MTMDDDLVKTVDRVSRELHISRSAFTRKALRDALVRCAIEKLERKHRGGYEQYPVSVDEFAVWDSEQVWSAE
jgi:metal-responsive CopG/Arc/MetJ family transcriptional regulator